MYDTMVTKATVESLSQLYAENKDIIDHIIEFSRDELERKYMMLIRDIASGLYIPTEPIIPQHAIVQAAI